MGEKALYESENNRKFRNKSGKHSKNLALRDKKSDLDIEKLEIETLKSAIAKQTRYLERQR